MKLLTDAQRISAFGASQEGVFSKADLQTLLDERHPAALVRRLCALQQAGVLQRFVRNWYVTQGGFDLPTLSQRIAPDSYVSMGTVLARALVVGTMPARELWAVKCGRSRVYEGLGFRIVHLGVAEHLLFGAETDAKGVRWASPEKALLDVLYFHLRGRRYPFAIYSDLNIASLDMTVLHAYLGRYRNPKFAVFVKEILNAAS